MSTKNNNKNKINSFRPYLLTVAKLKQKSTNKTYYLKISNLPRVTSKYQTSRKNTCYQSGSSGQNDCQVKSRADLLTI